MRCIYLSLSLQFACYPIMCPKKPHAFDTYRLDISACGKFLVGQDCLSEVRFVRPVSAIQSTLNLASESLAGDGETSIELRRMRRPSRCPALYIHVDTALNGCFESQRKSAQILVD
jgi:hypothetical protein